MCEERVSWGMAREDVKEIWIRGKGGKRGF